MRKAVLLVLGFILATGMVSFAAGNLLVDDFEVDVSGGPAGTFDFGAGNGSSLAVTADKGIKNGGNQSIKVVYDAIKGGYMYIAKGSGLDAKSANW
ncbi:MAG: hypothetical protein NTZ92_00555, partial [Candidatus Omnitrophica bacterium]|nr:hypothetical protein [Candidatus Omnitrophota bacterium]